jgi:thiamine-phosphate pyrophosphorylase
LPKPTGGPRAADPCRLYLVTPPAFELAPFADALAAALDAGDVACVQLRLKDASDDAIKRAAERLLRETAARDVALVMNDRPDLAAATGCDGVHVGQEDASYAAARAAVGTNAIVGVTCHASPHLAMEAGEAGADYVAFGAFFPTTTKDAKTKAEPDILRWWSSLMTVPCVAIGGITAENCGPLVEAGADFLAVVSGVWSHPGGPAAGVRALNAAIAQAAERKPG